MITKVRVRNFKSLDDVEIDNIPRFVCLIGVNGSGKTTFIQLLTFIRALVRGEVDKWTIGGKACELKALAYAGGVKRNLEIEVSFQVDGVGYSWSVAYNLYEGVLVRETLEREKVEANDRQRVLSFESGVLTVHGEQEFRTRVIPRGAALSVPIDDVELRNARAALSNFEGVGVLDPIAIAEVARPVKGDVAIEENGAKLAAFVSRLSVDQKVDYTKTIRNFYADFDSVDVKGAKFGWKKLVFTELKKSLDALHMSYGTLRFMVMAALKYSKAGLLYFDEVDNGFNQEYLGKLVGLLRSFTDKQVFVTTHNVQFLNNLQDDELRRGVLFFYKDAQHKTHVRRFFAIREMAEALQYDAAGSIVSMTDLVGLGRRLLQEDGE